MPAPSISRTRREGRTTSYGLWNLAWLARPAELAFTVEAGPVLDPFCTWRPTRSAVERVGLPLAGAQRNVAAMWWTKVRRCDGGSGVASRVGGCLAGQAVGGTGGEGAARWPSCVYAVVAWV
jgi:hypothetical protein